MTKQGLRFTVRDLIANTLDTEERMLGVIYVVDSDAKGDWREHEIIEEEYEIEVEGEFKPFGVTDET